MDGLASAANYSSIFLNSMAAINSLYRFFFKPKTESFNAKFVSKASEYGTSAFYLINSIKNIFNRSKVKDSLGAAGFGLEALMSLVVSKANLFLLRGIPVGMYMFSNGVKDAVKKMVFNSHGEYFDSFINALTKLKDYFKDPVKNFRSPDSGMQSMLAGIFLVLGPIVGKLTGSDFLGSTIRNAGAITQDVSQLKPEYKTARPIYYKSGINYVIGTALDWVGRGLEAFGVNKNIVKLASSLTYIFDGFGAYLQGEAQDKEVGQAVAIA